MGIEFCLIKSRCTHQRKSSGDTPSGYAQPEKGWAELNRIGWSEWKWVWVYINILWRGDSLNTSHSGGCSLVGCSNTSPLQPIPSSELSLENHLCSYLGLHIGSLQESLIENLARSFCLQKLFFVQFLNYLKGKLRLCICIQTFSPLLVEEEEEEAVSGVCYVLFSLSYATSWVSAPRILHEN